VIKPYVIRKQECGHYSIFKVDDILNVPGPVLVQLYNLYGEKFVSYDFCVREIAHLETFSDVLLLLNVSELAIGEY
jgi:hypothetical protein